MQIHELTKKQLDEASVIDRIRQAGSAVKKGVQNIPAQAAAANQAAGASQQAKTQTQAEKYAEILRKQGFTGQTAPAPTSAVSTGQRVKIVAAPPGRPNAPQANYYKTDKGWENELGQPITNPASVAYLEKLYAGQIGPAAAKATATTRQAGAVMTSVDVDQAIRQLGLSQQQLQAFQAQAKQNPGFVQAFLKRLGLVR